MIVGAGPAGATLAFLLAERGVDVTLFERHDDFSREFRGERVLRTGFDALFQMGFEDQVRALPQQQITGADVYRDKKLVFSADFRGEGPVYLPQAALLEMIVHEASERFGDRFRLERGSIVRDLLWDHGRVIGVNADTSDGNVDFKADLVIGADGRTSLVRRRAHLEAIRSAHHDDQFDIAWARFPMVDLMRTNQSRMYLGEGNVVGFMRDPYDGLQVAWIIDKGSFGDLRKMGRDRLVAELASHVTDDIGDHLRSHAADASFSLLDVYCTSCERWAAPGIALVGDAAHTMSPSGGQGINMALRDSIVAANHLAPVLRRSPTVDDLMAACRAFQQERTPEINAIQEHQRRIPVVRHQRTPMSKALLTVIPFVGRLFPQVLTNLMGGGRKLLNGVTPVRLDPVLDDA